jgi:hypothetical protein
VRLGKNKEKAGDCFLTPQRRIGGRESGGEAAATKIDVGGRTSMAATTSSVGDARDPVDTN